MPLKQVKNKIRSVEKIHKVTKAMEAVSAVKMRKSQERALLGRPYARAALRILENLSGSMEGLEHPLTGEREIKKACLVVITSDKGLAGSLNTSVLKEAQKKVDTLGKDHTRIITIGKKARDYFHHRDYTILSEYENDSERVDVLESKEIVSSLTERYQEKEFDICYLVYANFVSTFEQKAVIRQVLPVSIESVNEVVRGIAPKDGRYADGEEIDIKAPKSQYVHSYEVEPSPEAVLSLLFSHLISIELYHGLLESRASEHSARMVAMKNASDKADELSGEFRLEYNKERQAQITGEVSEIVSGIETT